MSKRWMICFGNYYTNGDPDAPSVDSWEWDLQEFVFDSFEEAVEEFKNIASNVFDFIPNLFSYLDCDESHPALAPLAYLAGVNDDFDKEKEFKINIGELKNKVVSKYAKDEDGNMILTIKGSANLYSSGRLPDVLVNIKGDFVNMDNQEHDYYIMSDSSYEQFEYFDRFFIRLFYID